MSVKNRNLCQFTGLNEDDLVSIDLRCVTQIENIRNGVNIYFIERRVQRFECQTKQDAMKMYNEILEQWRKSC